MVRSFEWTECTYGWPIRFSFALLCVLQEKALCTAILVRLTSHGAMPSSVKPSLPIHLMRHISNGYCAGLFLNESSNWQACKAITYNIRKNKTATRPKTWSCCLQLSGSHANEKMALATLESAAVSAWKIQCFVKKATAKKQSNEKNFWVDVLTGLILTSDATRRIFWRKYEIKQRNASGFSPVQVIAKSYIGILPDSYIIVSYACV